MRGERGPSGISPMGEADVIPADVSDLMALEADGLVILRRSGSAAIVGNLRQRAFEAVASDFASDAVELREAAIRRLGLEGLHPEILAAANDLFTDGHYSQAIFEAFKALEVRVRRQSSLAKSGSDLMAKAFGSDAPPIRIATETGRSGEDEQEGFRFLFMGAMLGIRNPKGHEQIQQKDPQRTLEYLAFASLLMRRLDDAAGR